MIACWIISNRRPRIGYDRLARENYSTLLWAPGEIITDGFAVPVAPDAPDGVYTLSLGWYRKVAGQASSLPITDPDTGELTGETAVTIGPIKVGGPPSGVTVTEAKPHNELNVVLGDAIKLLGFDVVQGASSLDLTFFWLALAQPEKDYTVFVHIRNEDGETIAQKDRPPVEGAYPTSLWNEGETIKDDVSIPLDTLSHGKYEVVVGMYDFVTGERLEIEHALDNAIRLQSFEVDGE